LAGKRCAIRPDDVWIIARLFHQSITGLQKTSFRSYLQPNKVKKQAIACFFPKLN